MPKLGMEPVRRAALVRATIDEIGATGTLDITVSKIAKRAGMSSALAHHYFGGKDQIFLAAMRHTLTVYGREVRAGLAKADGPKARLEAIIRASFTSSNFRRDVIAAWLNFYVLAQSSPLIGARAGPAAPRIAGLIDGLYLRQGLARDPDPSDGATRHVLTVLTAELKGNAQ